MITFNPGWVRTDMGGADATLAPEDSVAALRKLIDAFPEERSGGFIDYTGDDIPW